MSTSNIWSFAGALAPLGLSVGMGLASVSCTADEFTVAPVDGDAAPEAGDAGDAASDGGGLAPAPTPVHPSPNQVLTPTQSYFSWSDGTIPGGLTVDHYQFCWTSGPMTDIDTDAKCPNPSTPKTHRQVAAPLTKNATYLWKVQEVFSDATKSAFSGVQTFSTDDSAVEWLPMDEGSGTTTADSSGNGNNGTLTNAPTWVSGFVGKALQFGGTSYVSVPAASSLDFGSGDFTFSARIKTGSSGARQAIFEKIASGNGYYFYVLASGALGFFGGSCGIAVSGGAVTDGKWHEVSATRSGGAVSLAVDRTPTGSAACADNFSNSSALAVGCNSPSLGCVDPFNGIIDDVQLYKRVLTTKDFDNNDCAALVLSGATTFPASCD